MSLVVYRCDNCSRVAGYHPDQCRDCGHWVLPWMQEKAKLLRVQIPVYTDRWMMGDRYGEVVKVIRTRKRNGNLAAGIEIAHVKLDKSGKTVRVILAECTEV